MFTLEKQTREWERKHPQYVGEATHEDAERYRKMCEQVAAIERDRAISKEVAEIDELLDFVEVIEENARTEIQELGFVVLLDDLEELEDFALVDGYINALEDLFAVGEIGGAEIYEYDELMDEFDEMMTREYRV